MTPKKKPDKLRVHCWLFIDMFATSDGQTAVAREEREKDWIDVATWDLVGQACVIIKFVIKHLHLLTWNKRRYCEDYVCFKVMSCLGVRFIDADLTALFPVIIEWLRNW